MVRSHAQGLDEELDRLINAVLVVQTETTHIQSICVSGVHSENITETEGQQEQKYIDCVILSAVITFNIKNYKL